MAQMQRICPWCWRPELGRSPEEGMATYSSILAWRIPWREEPCGQRSTGSQRVSHDWSDLACTHTHTHRVGYKPSRPDQSRVSLYTTHSFLWVSLCIGWKGNFLFPHPQFIPLLMPLSRMAENNHTMLCATAQERSEGKKWSRSVVSDSLRPHEL